MTAPTKREAAATTKVESKSGSQIWPGNQLSWIRPAA
jgi:hypothetical protein